MTRRPIDYSLYLVTDRGLARGRSTLEVVQAAVRGGVTCVQLREKSASTRRFLEEAFGVKAFLKDCGIPLIVNDRVDVALAVGADGVHLGQNDMPLATARALVGSAMVIGISAESLGDALEAQAGGADYLGASPVFATATKSDAAPPLGLAGLRAIRQAVRLPLVAIGGLNRGNAAAAVRHGADGVAVVSAIVSTHDPEAAARAMRGEIEAARRP
jgi:thiamine-phosphate pyrophosphorylase